MKKIESKIPYNYKTIKVTQSRLNKGLLAIPVSLIDYFPKDERNVYVTFGNKEEVNIKKFTPYSSSSRECRIGGMKTFYERFHVSDGDELVVQFIDKGKYRILTETQFESFVLGTENQLDEAKNEYEADSKITQISKFTNLSFDKVVLNEFFRLSKNEIKERKYSKTNFTQTKESVPPFMRRILGNIYQGKCQITGFGFLKRDGTPYFELHHINPDLGHHPKNLLVVCPNVHAQFTYANLSQHFDEEGWLRNVKFNNEKHLVNQKIDELPKNFEKEIHYI